MTIRDIKVDWYKLGSAVVLGVVVVYIAIKRDIPELQSDSREVKSAIVSLDKRVTVVESHIGSIKDDQREIKMLLMRSLSVSSRHRDSRSEP